MIGYTRSKSTSFFHSDSESMLVNEIMQLNWVQLVVKYSILIYLNPITLGLNNILFVTRHVYYSTEISWYRI